MKMIAFKFVGKPHNGQWWTGYDKVGDPSYGGNPRMHPEEFFEKVVRKHIHLLSCNVHYFEVVETGVKQIRVAALDVEEPNGNKAEEV